MCIKHIFLRQNTIVLRVNTTIHMSFYYLVIKFYFYTNYIYFFFFLGKGYEISDLLLQILYLLWTINNFHYHTVATTLRITCIVIPQQVKLHLVSNIKVNNINFNFIKPDYYDLYDDEFVNTHDEHSSFWSHLTFHQLCAQCVLPAVWSTCNLLGTTLISCIFFRLFIVISKKTLFIANLIIFNLGNLKFKRNENNFQSLKILS